MTCFVLISNIGRTDANFTLNSLPNAGRLDLVARCINSTFWISDGIRKENSIYIILRGPPNYPRTIKIIGEEMRRMSPDERNIGSTLKELLSYPPSKTWKTNNRGGYIRSADLDEILPELERPIYILLAGSNTIKNTNKKATYILGDNKGLLEEDIRKITSAGGQPISLGDTVYLASQCITIINYMSDQ